MIDNKNILSINMLITKNNEILKTMRAKLSGIMSKKLDFETYTIETDFGNKIIKGSIVTPDVAKIALEDISTLRHKVEENNVIIENLRNELPVIDYSLSQMAALLIKSSMLSGILLKIDEGSVEVETIDGKIIMLEEGEV